MNLSTSNEFAPAGSYFNTAMCGLHPARTVAAVRHASELYAVGDLSEQAAWVAGARASYARLAGVPADRVAVGSAVSIHSGLVASGLAAGSEVVVADGDFSSVIGPFAVRPDLKVRSVPLERLAEEIRPQTALVAVSSVQSADGRIADLGAIREAAARHGTRTYVDATQSTGWLPLEQGGFDYVTCAAFKWLLCPRGTTFLTVGEEAAEQLVPVFAGSTAGEVPAQSNYGAVTLAESARRFDSAPSFLAYAGAAASLSLIEEIGVAAIAQHDLALSRRFEEGARALGHEPISGGTPIITLRGLADAAPALAEAGMTVTARNGNLRVSFHLHNSEADVDALLSALPRR